MMRFKDEAKTQQQAERKRHGYHLRNRPERTTTKTTEDDEQASEDVEAMSEFIDDDEGSEDDEGNEDDELEDAEEQAPAKKAASAKQQGARKKPAPVPKRNWRKLDSEREAQKRGAEKPSKRAKNQKASTQKPVAFTCKLDRKSSLGPVALEGSNVSVGVQGAFLQAWGAHIASIQQAKYNGKKGEKKKRKDLDNGTTGRRNLDRIAWVLEKLAPGSVCVAVLEAEDGLYAYANNSSTLAAAIQKLAAYAANNGPTQQQLQDFEQILGGGRKPKQNAQPTERLNRACQVLREIGKNLKVHANETEDKHAELHAVDLLVSLGDKSMADLGISKLCCAKCYMALYAIGKQKLVSGAHFKTRGYGKWAIPHFLTGEDVMKKFLGAEAYKHYAANKDGLLRIIATHEPSGVTGSNETDPVFSDEEKASS